MEGHLSQQIKFTPRPLTRLRLAIDSILVAAFLFSTALGVRDVLFSPFLETDLCLAIIRSAPKPTILSPFPLKHLMLSCHLVHDPLSVLQLNLHLRPPIPSPLLLEWCMILYFQQSSPHLSTIPIFIALGVLNVVFPTVKSSLESIILVSIALGMPNVVFSPCPQHCPCLAFKSTSDYTISVSIALGEYDIVSPPLAIKSTLDSTLSVSNVLGEPDNLFLLVVGLVDLTLELSELYESVLGSLGPT